MRLRDNIRPPDRYDSDLFYTPASTRSLRESRTPSRPRIIDYDPSLPPAAFPTIDRPYGRRSRPSIPRRDSLCGAASDPANLSGCRRSDKSILGEDCVAEGDLEDIPLRLVENHVASNGNLNPIYRSNMAIMRESEHSASLMGRDMEDSDSDDVVADDHEKNAEECAMPIQDPEWRDICPAMQADIFVNIIEHHSREKACQMLGLTEQQSDGISDLLLKREKQIQIEKDELDEMRKKQSRALLRTDGSSWRHSRTPHQLLFRKASRQCIRRLRERIELDYFTCHVGDLELAKRFLRNRGLDCNFVGEWSNCKSAHESTKDSTELKEPALRLEIPENTESLGQDSPTPTFSHSVDDHDRFVNGVEKKTRRRPRSRTYPNNSDASSQMLEFIHQNYQHVINDFSWESPNSTRLVCLRIGRERAAQIRESHQLDVEPRRLWHRFPPIDIFFHEPQKPLFRGCTSPETPSKSKSIHAEDSELIEQDTMVDNQPNSSAEPTFQAPLATSSQRLRQRLEDARLEAQQERLADQSSDNMDFDEMPSALRRSPILRSRSSPVESPSKCLTPKSEIDPGDTILSPLDNTVSPSEATFANNGSDTMANSPGLTVDASPMTSPSLHSHTSCFDRSSFLRDMPMALQDDAETEEDEADGDCDSMILIPGEWPAKKSECE